MQIRLYELRDDEIKAFERASAALPEGYSIAGDRAELTPETARRAMGCEGVVINNKSILDASLVNQLAALGVRFIALRCTGYDHIDLEAAKKRGIRVCNTTYPPYGVAEFTLMLMLMALRRCKPALWREQVNDYSLDGLLGRELRTLTVGVMGTGRIGRTVIQLLSGFGCEVVAYDPYPNADLARDLGFSYVDPQELYARADLVTLHMPLMDSTRGIIDDRAISRMRDGVVIVNVSRGELVDTDALVRGIESQKIGALAMDVFAGEEGIYHENRVNDILANRTMAYLRQFPNVVLTHHIAFYTDVNVDSMVEQGVGGVVAMSQGACATEL